MSKIVPVHDIGIPVPSPPPDPTLQLIIYYGPAGFTPAYTPVAPAGRIPSSGTPGPALSTLTTKTDAAGVLVYDDPIGAQLPSNLASGSYDLYFTLADANGNEGDFSPKLNVSLDVVVPPTLGQPVLL